jgi:hypothetical protein
MNHSSLILVSCIMAVIGLSLLAARVVYRRMGGRWIVSYCRQYGRRSDRAARGGAPVHLLLCIADHYEPHNGKVSDEQADRRVETWLCEYRRLFGRFQDSDGRPPRHTFFYPIEHYTQRHVDSLTQLCASGFGEVEIHLHHDHDTAHNLRQTLLDLTRLFHERHGLLPRHRETGELGYAFVHGNWALDNSRPDGRWCGVNNELDVLRETGCYADLTLPSAPSPTQTRQTNSIYYAVDDPAKPKSHDTGVEVGAAPRPENSLLMIQGPLMLNWRSRKWGALPRIENSCIHWNQPPTEARLNLWLRAAVQVPMRPDWFFVKLHTHGAPEANQRILLGPAMTAFHEALARRASSDRRFHFHYVTAREMYNLVKAAEAGWDGDVAGALDYEMIWPPARTGVDAGGSASRERASDSNHERAEPLSVVQQ